jgi:hypothetical protein
MQFVHSTIEVSNLDELGTDAKINDKIMSSPNMWKETYKKMH